MNKTEKLEPLNASNIEFMTMSPKLSVKIDPIISKSLDFKPTSHDVTTLQYFKSNKNNEYIKTDHFNNSLIKTDSNSINLINNNDKITSQM